MGLLANLIAALRYYLQIQAVKASYELTRLIDEDNARDEAERDRLRALGDPNSQLAADRMQQRILRRAGIAVPDYQPIPGPAPASRPAGPNP